MTTTEAQSTWKDEQIKRLTEYSNELKRDIFNAESRVKIADDEIERLKKIIEKLWTEKQLLIEKQLLMPLSSTPPDEVYEQLLKNLWQQFKMYNDI